MFENSTGTPTIGKKWTFTFLKYGQWTLAFLKTEQWTLEPRFQGPIYLILYAESPPPLDGASTGLVPSIATYILLSDSLSAANTLAEGVYLPLYVNKMLGIFRLRLQRVRSSVDSTYRRKHGTNNKPCSDMIPDTWALGLPFQSLHSFHKWLLQVILHGASGARMRQYSLHDLGRVTSKAHWDGSSGERTQPQNWGRELSPTHILYGDYTGVWRE